jgi:hypothetical protein
MDFLNTFAFTENISTSLRLAMRALARNKMRSSLTMLSPDGSGLDSFAAFAHRGCCSCLITRLSSPESGRAEVLRSRRVWIF